MSSTERTLKRVADSFAMSDVEIGVLPTLVIVRAHDADTQTIDVVAADGEADLRLDQIGALYDIVDVAQAGRLSASDGLLRVAEVWSMPARFGATVRILGQVVLSLGLGLIITPQATSLVYCAVLGLVVGILIELGGYSSTLRVLLPAIASLLVAVTLFLATRAGLVVAPLMLLIPPLITFLPGGMLTTAMVELADHHPLAGASRLVAGFTQVLLLVFGIVAGQVLVDLPPALAFAKEGNNSLGAWALWVGPLMFAVGVYYHFVGPHRSLTWLIVIVYVAWLGEELGNLVVGGYLSGFVGATIMTVVAFWVDRLPSGPPFQVLFLPAFWLLVPGVLAVVGLADLVGNEDAVALLDLSRVLLSILSIALGVLVGVALARAMPQAGAG